MPKISVKTTVILLALSVLIFGIFYFLSTKNQGWRTYRNKQYGFELQRPKDSQLQEIDNAEYLVSLTGPNLNYRLLICPNCVDFINDTVEIVKTETVIYPHFSAQHMVVVMDPENDPEYHQDYLAISTPKRNFDLLYLGDQNVIKQILSTLKFDLL